MIICVRCAKLLSGRDIDTEEREDENGFYLIRYCSTCGTEIMNVDTIEELNKIIKQRVIEKLR